MTLQAKAWGLGGKIDNVVALYYIFTSKPTEKEVGLQPKIDEYRFSIFR